MAHATTGMPAMAEPEADRNSGLYFEVQRIVALVAEAAAPHPLHFDPEFRLRQELRRALRDIPESGLPADLSNALLSGEVVGPGATRWLPVVRDWLTQECQRTGD